MLRELEIKNFALIEHVRVGFGPGLNVLSGETGAGKSILLLALQLVLGAKAHNKFLRSGADHWEVQALFDIRELPGEIRKQLPDIAAEGEELAVFRSGNAQGKGKVYINGMLASLSLLQDISSRLIAICSQSEHLALLHSRFHLSLLDSYARHEEILQRYEELYSQKEILRKEMANREAQHVSRERRMLELEDMLRELREIPLQAGLRRSWESEISRLTSAEKLTRQCQEVRDFYTQDQGLEDMHRRLAQHVQALSKLDPALQQSLLPICDALQISAQEILVEVQRYAAHIEIDEETLELRREQLSKLARLERKYGRNDAELASYGDELEQELHLGTQESRLETLRQDYEQLSAQLQDQAARLGQSRRDAAKKLKAAVRRELRDVNMTEALFDVAFTEKECERDGADKVEFLLSANRGEKPRPLQDIASGGELSRMTLVLKKILRDQSSVNVLVFDEIDTGISGAVARAVGQKLKALASGSQVLCISHLAQVASLADQHFLVRKSSGERTVTDIQPLSRAERVEEIARMLSGSRITDASRISAEELLTSEDKIQSTY